MLLLITANVINFAIVLFSQLVTKIKEKMKAKSEVKIPKDETNVKLKN